MDKVSDFESEDCEFESRRGRIIILFIFIVRVSLMCCTRCYRNYVIKLNVL